MRELYQFRVRYVHAFDDRLYRVTVVAHDTDDARRIAKLRDPAYLNSRKVTRGKRVQLEEPDPIDAAKWRTTVEFDRATVEVDVA